MNYTCASKIITHKIVNSSAMCYHNLTIIHEWSKQLLKMTNNMSIVNTYYNIYIYIYTYLTYLLKRIVSDAEPYCSSFWSCIGKSAQVEKLVSAGNRTRVYGMERHSLNVSIYIAM